jgi:hypothetical protein
MSHCQVRVASRVSMGVDSASQGAVHCPGSACKRVNYRRLTSGRALERADGLRSTPARAHSLADEGFSAARSSVVECRCAAINVIPPLPGKGSPIESRRRSAVTVSAQTSRQNAKLLKPIAVRRLRRSAEADSSICRVAALITRLRTADQSQTDDLGTATCHAEPSASVSGQASAPSVTFFVPSDRLRTHDYSPSAVQMSTASTFIRYYCGCWRRAPSGSMRTMTIATILFGLGKRISLARRRSQVTAEHS